MTEPIHTPIGLSDSQLQGYARDGNVLVVRVTCWNHKVVILKFLDVIGLRDILAGEFSAAVRGATASENFLEETLKRNFSTLPSVHPYQIYSFLNHDEDPSLDVVAASCHMSVEESLPA